MRTLIITAALTLAALILPATATEASGPAVAPDFPFRPTPHTARQKKKNRRPSKATPVADNRCAPVRKMKQLGMILDVRNSGADIYVSRDWYAGTYAQKEAVAANMLECLNPGHHSITIHDGHSGKRIGYYGTAWGFKSYE